MKTLLASGTSLAIVSFFVAILWPAVARTAELDSQLFQDISNEDVPGAPCGQTLHTASGRVAGSLVPTYLSYDQVSSAIAGDLEGLKDGLSDPNAVEEDSGRSLLMLAAAAGHFDLVRFLIHRGACVDTRNLDGGTALLQASRTKLLYPESGRATTPGYRQIVEYLLMQGADPNAVSANKMTPLLCAAYEGHTDIMTPLLDGGAKLNVGGSHDWTPLMVAANYGHSGTVDFLLERGAEIEKKDPDDLTALMLATLEGHASSMESLIAAGAEIDTQGRLGHSSLMIASMRGNVETLKVLLRHNADMSLTNYKGQTAIMLAKERGHSAIAQILEDAVVDN